MGKRALQLLPPRSSPFLAAALFLFIANPAAAQVPPHKETPFEVDTSGGRFQFRGPGGAIFLEGEPTDNFMIFYNPTEATLAFVDLVAQELEASWRFFHDAGYRHPAFADHNRVAVYIRSTFTGTEEWAAGFYRLFVASGDPYFDLRHQDVSDAGNRDFARSLCTHEFFHFIQHAYDNHFSAGIRWLWEATAAWSEDERVPGISWGACYLRHTPRWYTLWSMGISLNAFNQGDANILYMPYGSSLYFKYLSEHHASGNALVRRIWEGIGGAGGGNGFAEIQAAVGGERQFQDLFADFGVAALLKTHAPWNFHRGGEIGSAITPRRAYGGLWYVDGWDEAGHQIEPVEHTIEPLCVSYLELTAPAGYIEAARATRLRIVLEPEGAAAGLRAKVVRLSDARETPNVVGVDEVPPAAEGPAQIVVEDYGFWRDRTWRVFLLLANTTASPIRVKVAAAVSQPPYLQRLAAQRPSGEILYEAAWQDRGAGAREFVVQTNEEMKVQENRLETIQITADFSRELSAAPTLQAAGRPFTLQRDPSVASGTRWTIQVAGLTVDAEQLKRRTLRLQVEAASPDGLNLDVNPATGTILDPRRLQWDGYDPPGGGPDGAHVLRLEKDLNGLWRAQDSTMIRIQHRDPSVEGSTMGGNPLFRGTLRERQITGQVKVRYPPEWQARCPGQAEGWARLELTVSEDKDTLNGRFELKEIDEKCNQVHAGWKPTTLERVPEEEAGALGR